MKITIERIETGGRLSFMFGANCDGRPCGRIGAHRQLAKVRGRVVYSVDDVRVTEAFRRRGVATKLYEAAAREACSRRGRLASVSRLDAAHSTAFWEKQVAKGRAVKVRGGRYVLLECPAPSLARLR